MEMWDIFLVAQVNALRSTRDAAFIEFKALKTCMGYLIVRDSCGREVKIDIFAGQKSKKPSKSD